MLKRKVRNGRVKINNAWYYPSVDHMKYDGRLDGHWFYFGTYQGDSSLICLHSSVDLGVRPHIIDGELPWLFWHKK